MIIEQILCRFSIDPKQNAENAQGTVVNMQPAAPLEKEDVKSADKAGSDCPALPWFGCEPLTVKTRKIGISMKTFVSFGKQQYGMIGNKHNWDSEGQTDPAVHTSFTSFTFKRTCLTSFLLPSRRSFWPMWPYGVGKPQCSQRCRDIPMLGWNIPNFPSIV